MAKRAKMSSEAPNARQLAADDKMVGLCLHLLLLSDTVSESPETVPCGLHISIEFTMLKPLRKVHSHAECPSNVKKVCRGCQHS